MTSESHDETLEQAPSTERAARKGTKRAGSRAKRSTGSQLSVDTRDNPVIPASAPPLPKVSAAEAARSGVGPGGAPPADEASDAPPVTEEGADAAGGEPAPAPEPEDERDQGDEAAPDPAETSETEESESDGEAETEPAAEAAPVPDPEVDTAPEPEPEADAASDSAPAPEAVENAIETAPALAVRDVTKSYGGSDAVTEISLTVPRGSFYGLVGPNGAGKTTLLSMIAGLLRPTAGTLEVCGIDLVEKPREAKRLMGVLPDRLRTFDRLTGRQLLYYFGVLRGLKPSVIASRTDDLARVFDLTAALNRVVADYSAGMTKKVMLAGAMIHSPRVLVLDEPFEAVDPVSSETILGILQDYVAGGGTVILSSHGMDLVEKVCSRLAVVVSGQILAEGTVDEVKGNATLEQRFVELSGGISDAGGLEWLHASSD